MTKERAVGEAYLKNVRLSFPHFAKPHASVRGGPEKYRASFLMDPTTPDGKKAIAECQRAAREVIEQAWPKAAGKFPGKPDRKCLRKGDDVTNQQGEVRKGYEGMVVVSANSDSQPTLIYRNKKRVPDGDIAKTFYAGCRVEAIIRFYAVTDPDKGGAGLFASLEGVRFFGDDEAFGGSGVSEDDFDDYSDEEDDFESGEDEGDDDLL